jgi:hypothetical protein
VAVLGNRQCRLAGRRRARRDQSRQRQ